MPLRTRTRIINDQIVFKFAFLFGGDGTVHTFSDDWSSFQHYHSIIDATGNAGDRYFRVKPCYSLSMDYVGVLYHTWFADHGYSIESRVPKAVGNISPSSLKAYTFPDIPNSVVALASQRAFNHFSERFPNAISGSEFVQGLLELGALLPSIGESILSTIAGGFLNKEFGWDNLLRDLKSLSGAFKACEKRMEFLKSTRGKPVIVHYYEPSFYDSVVGPLYGEYTRGFGQRLTRLRYRSDYHASCTIVQNLDHIDDAVGWLRAAVDAIGLNNPLEAAWKVLPYSFVADWFFNVSAFLARSATIQPAEEWRIFDVTYSVAEFAVVKFEQVDKDLFDSPNQEFVLGEYTCKQYRRGLNLPLDLSVFTPSSLTPKQLVLLLAMLATHGL